MQKLILIRGLPGSGKSTLAKEMLKKDKNGLLKHFEADMYFESIGGYDPLKIKEAHEWCQSETKRALNRGFTVIVSNTFVKKWEIFPYLYMTMLKNKIPLSEIDLYELHKESILFHIYETKGQYESIHNVPKEVIEAMRKNWEEL
jgi:hypothetical protein